MCDRIYLTISFKREVKQGHMKLGKGNPVQLKCTFRVKEINLKTRSTPLDTGGEKGN